MSDYYQQGLGLGQAYLDGQEIALRRREQALREALTQAQVGRMRGENDDAAYNRTRNRADDAERAALLDGGLPTPGGPTPYSQASSVDAGLPQPGGAAPATGVPAGAKPGPSRGDMSRLDAKQAFKRGDAKWNAHADLAREADWNGAFDVGSKNVDLDAWIKAGNNSGSPIAVHKDKDGYEFITIRPDGTTNKATLSEAQARQVAGFKNAMQINPQKSLQGIAKIDADLAAMFGTQLAQQEVVTRNNNQATHFGNTDQIARDRTAANIEIANLRLQATQARTDAARANKTIPPELLAEHNALIEKLAETDDPKERKKVISQINASETKIANAIGKPRGMPAERETPEVKINADGSVLKGGVLYVPDPKKVGAYKPAEGLGPTALDKAIAAAQSGAPAPAAAPVKAAPAVAPAARGIPAPAAPAPSTGIEGLSPIALSRIAATPGHPQQAVAAQAMAAMERDRRGSIDSTMQSPEYDPSLYGQ